MDPKPRPNILIIHADQHRWDCLGVNGNPDVQTPNIDALAKDGVRYTEHYCPLPVCTPSRYSLLSSQYVHQHLGWTNHCTLPNGVATFPRVLKQAGYRTKAVGKMHFAPTYLDVGFEEMQLAEQDGPGRFDDDYHRWLKDEGLIDGLDLMDQRKEYRDLAPPEYWETRGAMDSDLDEEHHSTTWIAERAVETVRDWHTGGHLLMVGFIKPHHPFDPPTPWGQMYDPKALTLLPGWLEQSLDCDLKRSTGYFRNEEHSEAQIRRAMAYYYASISQIDHHVGRLIDKLKAQGQYDNTLIIFTSDHGDYMGFHHMVLKGNYMYDPLIKIPLIIKYPEQKGAGKVDTTLTNNLDIGPTLLKAAGLPVPAGMQGTDLDDEKVSRDVVFAENWAGQEYMVRTRNRKLLLCQNPELSQLFDLEIDPLEMDNVINDPVYQDDLATLKAALTHWALFDARTPAHLDDEAPVIAGNNVPACDDGHVQMMADYFAKQMGRPSQA